MDRQPLSQNYSCSWSKYAERHYAKVFSKRYKNAWQATRNDITNVCKHIDAMLVYERADVIANTGTQKIVKLDFAIEGMRISPKASGNCCILFIDEVKRHVEVLIVYSKNEIEPPNETAKWKRIIRTEYSEIAERLSL